MTGVSKTTILKLVEDAGRAAAWYQDRVLRDLPCKRIQADEQWGFVGCKQRNRETAKNFRRGIGDAWLWSAICADSKLVIFCRFPIVSVSSPRDLAQQLDNLYAVGVGERNRLMPTIPEFDLDKETMIFTHWDNRVLALLDADFVNVAEKSSFRTLNLFQGISADAPNKTAEQRHIEAMWTEKLNRLKPIIDRVGRGFQHPAIAAPKMSAFTSG